jgi:hypothetical protein
MKSSNRDGTEYGGTAMAGGAVADISGAPMNTGVNLTTKEGKILNIRSLRRADLLAADRKVLIGEFSSKDGVKGIVTRGDGPDRAEFQFTPPATYMVETILTRLRGEDTIIFGLMVGGHRLSYLMATAESGPWSGLKGSSVADYRPNRRRIKGVSYGASGIPLRVFAKGWSLRNSMGGGVEWSGDAATLTRDPGHATPNAKTSRYPWGSSKSSRCRLLTSRLARNPEAMCRISRRVPRKTSKNAWANRSIS